MRRWLQCGRNGGGGGTYQQLVADTEHAKRQALQRALETVGTAVELDSRAAAWLLEPPFPDEFGPPISS